MKKTNWIALFLLLIATAGMAQNKRVYLGVNVNTVSKGLPGVSFHPKAGYQIGADIQLGKGRVYVQPGLQYATTGIGLSHPTYSDSKSSLRIGGVKIPVMVGLRVNFSSSSQLRFFTGPSFMFVTNVKHRNMDDPSLVLTDKEYHDVEWAGHLGAGLDIRKIFLDLGVQKGLTYVFTGGSKAKSNLFYLQAGLRF